MFHEFKRDFSMKKKKNEVKLLDFCVASYSFQNSSIKLSAHKDRYYILVINTHSLENSKFFSILRDVVITCVRVRGCIQTVFVLFFLYCLCFEIGALFENNPFYNEDKQMLEYAVNEANDLILQSNDIRLDVASEVIEYGREYAVSERVCSLLEV